jgi:hypothetical protein
MSVIKRIERVPVRHQDALINSLHANVEHFHFELTVLAKA